MRHPRRLVLLAVAAVVLAPLPALALSSPAPQPARVQQWLQDKLAATPPTTPLRVFVHANTAANARAAATASGLRVVETFDKVGVAVADGLPAQVLAARTQPGVDFLEGDKPVVPLLDSSHKATRGAEAVQTLKGPDGSPLDGSGVSIAIIDSGIDGTHPFFQKDGRSKVVANLKNTCPFVDGLVLPAQPTCFQSVPGNDSDTASAGGHGTHVAGIAGGYPVTTTSGKKLMGAAPGAKLIGLSVGQAVSVYGGDSGLNWVLKNHDTPCGAGVSVVDCPPIRVTNNSYGPAGGSAFDPSEVTVELQRALLREGVLTVWAAGNDGGDGSGSDGMGGTQLTNGPGNDPTPGILMVASYNDGGTGTRDGSLSSFSSRGVKGQTGTYPDISAPGDTILSACRPNLSICNSGATVPENGPAPTDVGTFNTISGTSMAAPHIAGIVAQLLEGKPTATPAQIESALENGARRFAAGAPYEPDPLNPGSPTSFDKGHGLVDVMSAYAQLTGTTAPAAADAPCTPDASFTDPSGDATNAQGTPGVTPNDPALDIVSSRLETAANGVVTFVIKVSDLTAPTGYGQYFDYNATIGGAGYFLSAQRTAGPMRTQSFALGDFGGPQGTRRDLGTLTGSFNDATDLIRINLPPMVAPTSVRPGTVIAGLQVVSRRMVDAVAISAIPDADTANGTCPYVVPSTTAAPPASATPTVTASMSPSPAPSASPSPGASASPSPGASATPTATASPSASPSPSPAADTAPPVVTVAVADPVTEDDDVVTVSGTLSDSSTATLTVTLRGGTGPAQQKVLTFASGGSRDYSVTFPAADFPDGTLTATASAVDANGNRSTTVTDTGEKDTVGVDILTATISPDPVTAARASTTTVSGTVQPTSETATVTVVVTGPGGSASGFAARSVVLAPGAGSYSVTLDLSGLPDGQITAEVSGEDHVDNQDGSVATATATKNAQGPVVTTTIAPKPVTPATTDITVSGRATDNDTATVTIVLSGGSRSETRTVVVGAGGGDYAVTFAAANFPDGKLTATATGVDTAGNTGRAADSTSKVAAASPSPSAPPASATPTATASPSGSPSPSTGPAPSASPSPSTGPAPSGSPSPSTGPAPSGSPSPSRGPSPSASPAPSGSPSPSASPAGALGRFHPVTPSRVLDTRSGTRVTAGSDRTVKVTGVGGVPATGVSSVVLNVTVTQATARGDLQVYPTGQRPVERTSNLNFFAGETVPVQVLTGVGSAGEINLSLNTGSAQVIVDVFGWYGDASDPVSGSSGFTPLQPQRLLDTRNDRAPVTAGADRTVPVAGQLGVPTGATAVVLNATVLGTPGNADLQVYPTGQRPASRTSNLNVRRGQTKANSVTVQIGSGGSVNLSISQGRAQVVLDVLGYYSPDSRGRFIPLTPARLLDTRTTTPPSPLRAGADRDVTVTGRGGVPTGAAAVVLSVTGTGAASPVDLQVFPTGNAPASRTSTVNFRPGEAVANVALATVGTAGRVTLSLSQGSAAVVLDAVGYITND